MSLASLPKIFEPLVSIIDDVINDEVTFTVWIELAVMSPNVTSSVESNCVELLIILAGIDVR